eukprot:scaffold112647_cov28-Tisochrysis_lutea.AAC.1
MERVEPIDQALSDGARGERHDLRRLDHDRIACNECGDREQYNLLDRVVPRCAHGDNAVRMAHDDRSTVHLGSVGLRDEVAVHVHVGVVIDLLLRLPQRLSHLLCDRPSKARFDSTDPLDGCLDERGPLAERSSRPAWLRRTGGEDGLVDF